MLGVTGCSPSQEDPQLPFFNSPELTPAWSSRREHHVTPFALTDQEGQRFDSTALNRKIYIASFIYTSCAGICPRP